MNRKQLKRLTAVTMAATMGILLTSCGDTSYSMKLGDITVPTGVYILNKMDTITAAQSHEDYDTATTDPLSLTLEGISFTDWVDREADLRTKEFLYTTQQFDALALTIPEEDLALAQQSIDALWPFYQESYEAVGVAESSLYAMIELDYKNQQLFLYTYGEDGTDPVTEDQLLETWEDDYAYIQVLSFSTLDDTGVALDDVSKELVEAEAEGYLARLEDGEDIVDLINDKMLEDNPDATIDNTADYRQLINRFESTSFEDDVRDEILDSNDYDEGMLVEDANGYYVVVRQEMTEGADYDEQKDYVRYAIKGEEFEAAVREGAEALTPEINQNTVNTFSVNHLMGL